MKQILDLLNIIDIKDIVKRHGSDRYYKTYTSKIQLITMLFGILSRCDSMGEICDGMRAMSGKLNHLGLRQSPAKSTACDGLRNRTDKFFEDVYFSLVKSYQSFCRTAALLLFKKMKQNFQLQYFYGENETAIRTQIWCTLIAQLLMTVLQKKAETKKAFSTIATLVRIHLISLLDVYELKKY